MASCRINLFLGNYSCENAVNCQRMYLIFQYILYLQYIKGGLHVFTSIWKEHGQIYVFRPFVTSFKCLSLNFFPLIWFIEENINMCNKHVNYVITAGKPL